MNSAYRICRIGFSRTAFWLFSKPVRGSSSVPAPAARFAEERPAKTGVFSQIFDEPRSLCYLGSGQFAPLTPQ
jgi:hypothetical protein